MSTMNVLFHIISEPLIVIPATGILLIPWSGSQVAIFIVPCVVNEDTWISISDRLPFSSNFTLFVIPSIIVCARKKVLKKSMAIFSNVQYVCVYYISHEIRYTQSFFPCRIIFHTEQTGWLNLINAKLFKRFGQQNNSIMYQCCL